MSVGCCAVINSYMGFIAVNFILYVYQLVIVFDESTSDVWSDIVVLAACKLVFKARRGVSLVE